MPSLAYSLLVVFGAGLVTWLSRIFPFVLLKHFNLPKIVIDYLSFVPITILSALWFSSLFTQHLGHLPSINFDNLLASLPAVLTAILSKNLLLTVLIGILSLAIIQLIL